MPRQRRHNKRSRGSRAFRGRRFWLPVVTLMAVALWSWLGPHLRQRLGLEAAPLESKGSSLRVIGWNLKNLGRDESSGEQTRLAEQDRVQRIAQLLEELDPDVVAFQEIRRPEVLEQLRPGWRFQVSQKGGRGGQLLALGWDPKRLRPAGPPREDHQLSLGGRVRPGFSMKLDPGGAFGPLTVYTVHLKAMRDGAERRREQRKLLKELLQTEVGPTLLVGDFNVTGGARTSSAQELAELERALAAVAYDRLEGGACSAYWDGSSRDAWKEPSLLDLVFAHDLPAAKVQTGAHCRAHQCAPLRSTAAYPDPHFGLMSDHCPLVIDVDLGEASVPVEAIR